MPEPAPLGLSVAIASSIAPAFASPHVQIYGETLRMIKSETFARIRQSPRPVHARVIALRPSPSVARARRKPSPAPRDLRRRRRAMRASDRRARAIVDATQSFARTRRLDRGRRYALLTRLRERERARASLEVARAAGKSDMWNIYGAIVHGLKRARATRRARRGLIDVDTQAVERGAEFFGARSP